MNKQETSKDLNDIDLKIIEKEDTKLKIIEKAIEKDTKLEFIDKDTKETEEKEIKFNEQDRVVGNKHINFLIPAGYDGYVDNENKLDNILITKDNISLLMICNEATEVLSEDVIRNQFNKIDKIKASDLKIQKSKFKEIDSFIMEYQVDKVIKIKTILVEVKNIHHSFTFYNSTEKDFESIIKSISFSK